MAKQISQNQKDQLAEVYQINPTVDYRVEEGVVLITKHQNHWIQRFFRKLYVRIPHRTEIKLDTYGSLVFQAIDGKNSIYEIGKLLEASNKEAGQYLYERLELYLHYLEIEEKWISLVE